MRRLLPLLVLLLGASAPQDSAAQLNILWITCQDISPDVACEALKSDKGEYVKRLVEHALSR